MVVKMSFDEDKALKSLNDSTDASILNNNACLNPLDPEFKIPAEPIMLEIKWQRPGENQCRCALRFIVLSYSRNGYSEDFLKYDSDPGGFLVVLDICRCVNATEANDGDSSFSRGRWA